MRSIRVDERTWEEASEARRLEWRATIGELLTPGEAVIRDDVDELRVAMTRQYFRIEGWSMPSAGGEELIAAIEVQRDQLEPLIEEYVDTVRELARADRSGTIKRIEALDMAKKVVHDKAGRLLVRRCRPLGLDHATARRLFTLLLAIRVDTSKLVGVYGHRRF